MPGENGTTAATALLDTNDIRPNYSLSGDYDWVVSDKFFVERAGGYYKQDQYNEGIPNETRFTFNSTTNIGLAGVPARVSSGRPASRASRPTAASRATSSGAATSRSTAPTTATSPATTRSRAACSSTAIANDVLDSEQRQPDPHQLESRRSAADSRGTFGYYQVRSNGVDPDQGFIIEGNIANTNIGLFIQDSWTINDRLTLNLGLRTENESVPSYTTADGIAPIAIEFGFGEKLAPRVGFAYDIDGDGKTKVFGYWGIFYDIFKLELPRGSFGGDKWLEYYYTLDTPNWHVARSAPAARRRARARLLLARSTSVTRRTRR